MTFQSDIPRSTDYISVSQQDLLDNFTSIGNLFPVNHVDFNASGAGKHKFVEMPNQSPDPAGAANEITLFSKIGNTSNSELFYKRDASASSFQLTTSDPSLASTPLTPPKTSTTFLPGGLIMKFGIIATDSSGNATISWAFGTNLFSATLTRLVNTGGANNRFSLYLTASSNASGTVKMVDSGGSGFADYVFWQAIGN